MFEKLRYKNVLKSKSKDFNCQEVAKALYDANTERASGSDWQINAASSAVFLSSVATDSSGKPISTEMKLEIGKNLRRFLNTEAMKALSADVSTMCERRESAIAPSVSSDSIPILLDGDAIFDQISKDWKLPEQLTNIAGSVIGAVLISLIIKVIIWLIIYWWTNNKK